MSSPRAPISALIQADAVESRTASFADLWLPIRAGSESALAAAVAGETTAGQAARLTGLAEKQIGDVIAELRNNGPSLVLARDASPEAVRANIALGAPGHTLVTRRETPVPDAWQNGAAVTALDAVPDGSIRVLFIDESAAGGYIPWSALAPKLVADRALVVAFAWTAEGYGKHARFTLPAPVCSEVMDDIPAALDGVAAAFRLSAPLVAPPGAVVNPPEFIARLAGLKAGQAFRERADAIHQTARGQVFSPADSKTDAAQRTDRRRFLEGAQRGGVLDGRKGTALRLPRLRGDDLLPEPRKSARIILSGSLAIVTGASRRAASFIPAQLEALPRIQSASDRPTGSPWRRLPLAPPGLTDGSRAVLEAGRRAPAGHRRAGRGIAAGRRPHCRRRRHPRFSGRPRRRKGGTRMKRYGMSIDLDRCTGCGACMVACAVENNIPAAPENANDRKGVTWIRVYKINNGEAWPDGRTAFASRCPGVAQHLAALRHAVVAAFLIVH